MVLKYLLEKEVKQFLRNSLLPRIAIVFPLLVLLVMPWATSFEVENVNVVIVDNDNTALSGRLAHKIEGSRYFNLVGVVGSYGEAIGKIERQEADVLLEIPDNFERSLLTGRKIDYQVSANSVNGVRGNLGANYMNALVAGFAAEAIDEETGRVVPQPVEVIEQYLYNELLDYKKLMVPALMIIVIIIICGILPALNIVSEKETGTIGQINVTPVGKWTFILAKLLPYWTCATRQLPYHICRCGSFHNCDVVGRVDSVKPFIHNAASHVCDIFYNGLVYVAERVAHAGRVHARLGAICGYLQPSALYHRHNAFGLLEGWHICIQLV